MTKKKKSAARRQSVHSFNHQQVAAPGKVRVRGRWLFRCFGCYVPEDELLLVEAERLNSKISKKERAEEMSKQRLLLGSSKRP